MIEALIAGSNQDFLSLMVGQAANRNVATVNAI
jgi:hypothetical protein